MLRTPGVVGKDTIDNAAHPHLQIRAALREGALHHARSAILYLSRGSGQRREVATGPIVEGVEQEHRRQKSPRAEALKAAESPRLGSTRPRHSAAPGPAAVATLFP